MTGPYQLRDGARSGSLGAEEGGAPMQNGQDIGAFIARRLESSGDAAPLYRRLAEALSEAVALGFLEARAALPSERRLAIRLGLSRVTVRRALEELAADGLLLRRQGARTTVRPRLEKALSTLTGFSDELRARGIAPGQRWIGRQVAAPSPSEALALGLATDARVVRLTRVRLADGQPIAIERAAVPQAILPSADLVEDSLYAALRAAGAPPVRGVQRIRASLMTRLDAELLDGAPGAPLLVVERRCADDAGRVVEFTETRYDGARYDFLAELRPEGRTIPV